MDQTQETVERRKYPRTACEFAGTVIDEGAEWRFKVLDLSQGGAMLHRLSIKMSMGRPITLKVDNVGVFTGKVAWRNPKYMGMRFVDPVSPENLRSHLFPRKRAP